MGGAIAIGAIGKGVVELSEVAISHLSEKMKPLLGDHLDSIDCNNCNSEAIKDADFIVLAVKPWLVEEVLAEISEVIDRSRQSIISVVAGVSFEQLSSLLDCESKGGMPLYRVIPNTAISIGCGVSVVAAHNATQDGVQRVVKLFEALGSVFTIEESMMAPFTSLASCGIAFALRYIDAAMRGGVEVGISQEQSLDVTLQTMQGALEMLRHNGTMPQTEIDKVTTKGGLTFKGLEAMEQGGFSESVKSAIKFSR